MSKEQGTKGLDIKPTQVAAGALASVTAAVLGSKLGVAGTVAGAGMASVVGTVGTAMYERSIQAARSRVTARIKQEEPPAGASHDAETVRLMVAPPGEETTGRRRWPLMVAGVVAAFVLGMGVLTVVELLDGHATSGTGNRTTVGALFGQPGQSTPAPTTSNAPPPTSSSATTSSSTPTTTSNTPPSSSSSTSTSTTTSSSTTTTTSAPQATTTTGGTPPGAN
ncbi:hypothetical protein [Kutzneria buriramensis]|uniref:Uncharacterized protein n=1 Tax=Kutzneria buriramensis TaxID=1045776 RepID=A0A3E0HVA3_9PSEU|nr:hypothetical protein [Kutzneria buriramensis]REH50339.1 hypothetical protein BCF44_104616 [Kutzneria buriramensis]